MNFARILLAYVFDILCTGYCSLSMVGMAIFHVWNLFLRSHGHMWSVYRAGRIGALCIWYVRLDFQYNCHVIILMFNHAECRIDKWHKTMTSHTRPGISTHWPLYCLLNSSLWQTRKKTSNRAFVRGIHRRWDRRTLNHESSTTMFPSNWNPLVTSEWFYRIQGQYCHQLLNDKLHNSNIIWVSWVFHSLASPQFVQQLVWANMK